MRRAVPALLLSLAACQSPTELSLDITAGHESDAFTAEPAVTRVEVAVTSLDGSVAITVSAAPGGTFDVGELSADQQILVEVTGLDAAGNTVMRGRSLSALPIGGISGTIPVFIQRTGVWARPPEGIFQAHVGGVATTLGEQYVVITGGASATKVESEYDDPAMVNAYDFLSLSGSAAAPYARVPGTLVSLSDAVLVIDAAGATWVDLVGSNTYDPPLPTGLASFGDVAGGTPVVGGTRAGEPTRGVLQVASDGTLTALELVQARAGAAAAWIEGVGLVVAGGSAEGPGVEVLATAGTAFAARNFPPDPVIGAAAVTDGGAGFHLVGGALGGLPAPTRYVNPSCGNPCAAQEIAGAAIPAALAGSQAYLLEGTRLIVVGNDLDGDRLTRTYLVDVAGVAEELLLKEPRRGAVPMPTPLGTLAILGGELVDGTAAYTVESYWPSK